MQNTPATPVDPTPKPRVALLVDGENFPPEHAGTAILRAARHGAVVVKCVVGDMARIPAWSAAPGFRAIHAGTGKNAADIRLVIEAMDLIHNRRADVLMIAASDGDYCHLALHMVERGVRVYGLGEAKAPDKLRKACTRFEEIGAPPSSKASCHTVATSPLLSASATPGAPEPKTAPVSADPVGRIRELIGELRTKDGWCSVQALGSELASRHRLTPASVGRRNWTAWLKENNGDYELNLSGPVPRVRLIAP